jgi:hypothetical protein
MQKSQLGVEVKNLQDKDTVEDVLPVDKDASAK